MWKILYNVYTIKYKNESDYIKFLLQFHKNNFEKNDI